MCFWVTSPSSAVASSNPVQTLGTTLWWELKHCQALTMRRFISKEPSCETRSLVPMHPMMHSSQGQITVSPPTVPPPACKSLLHMVLDEIWSQGPQRVRACWEGRIACVWLLMLCKHEERCYCGVSNVITVWGSPEKAPESTGQMDTSHLRIFLLPALWQLYQAESRHNGGSVLLAAIRSTLQLIMWL